MLQHPSYLTTVFHYLTLPVVCNTTRPLITWNTAHGFCLNANNNYASIVRALGSATVWQRDRRTFYGRVQSFSVSHRPQQSCCCCWICSCLSDYGYVSLPLLLISWWSCPLVFVSFIISVVLELVCLLIFGVFLMPSINALKLELVRRKQRFGVKGLVTPY